MVRRAEYAVRKATTKAQESGEVKERGDNLIPGARTRNRVQPTSSDDRPSPKDFFRNASEYEDANAMGDLDSDDFEAVLTEAKAGGQPVPRQRGPQGQVVNRDLRTDLR